MIDKRPVLLVAFANNPEYHLRYLIDEMKGIMATLEKYDYIFKISIIYDATIALIEKEIEEYGNRIISFMYSGHATGDKIHTQKHGMSAKGLKNQLQKCPNLKLIIINGCKSDGHIDFLKDLSAPLIIATESPVGDWAASIFARELFDELFKGVTISKAVKKAVEAAENYRGTIEYDIISEYDSLRFLGEMSQSYNKWILIIKDSRYKDWSIFDEADALISEYKPNNLLKFALFDNLIDLSKKYELEKSESEKYELAKYELITKIADYADYESAEGHILGLFPQFISKFIHDLCATPIGDISAGDRYDDISKERLLKSFDFFCAIQEVLISIVLAEIREAFLGINRPSSHPITLPLSEITQNIANKAKYIIASIEWLKIFPVKIFVKELYEVDYSKLSDIAAYFEKLKQTLETQQYFNYKILTKQCLDAEYNLIELLKQTLFLLKYQFLSIKTITVYKNRAQPEATFGFNPAVYEWKTPQNIDPATKAEKAPIGVPPDNFSVLMIMGANPWDSIKKAKYLNLSPFLIDKNIKFEKASLSHISYINVLSEKEYVYKSLLTHGSPFVVTSDMHVVFNDIQTQFSHFSKLIADQDGNCDRRNKKPI